MNARAAAETSSLPRPAMQALLSVQGVSKRFGGVTAIEDVSFDVAPGALVGLIGPNGSGKTTMFDMISCMQRPDAGAISFAGQRLDGLQAAQVARLGLIRTFQQTGIFAGMSVLQNMLASSPHAGQGWFAMCQRPSAAMHDRARHWLDFAGIAASHDQPAGELSYGQRKLLEFAMALMSEPKLLLLDEPTAGVSPAMVPVLIEGLRRANAELGVTVLFIEHNQQVVMSLARQVHCLTRGRLLLSGTPDEIRNDPRTIEAYLGPA